jgi:cysteine desulfuration protein SufE
MKITTAEELLGEFDDCLDQDERLQLILELGDDLDPLDETFKDEQHRVRGCTSNVWMTSEILSGEPERLHFTADSDSQIVRGLIAILLSLVNDRTPPEILAVDLEGIFERLELARYISRSRSNGLAAMVKRVRDTAARRQTQV